MQRTEMSGRRTRYAQLVCGLERWRVAALPIWCPCGPGITESALQPMARAVPSSLAHGGGLGRLQGLFRGSEHEMDVPCPHCGFLWPPARLRWARPGPVFDHSDIFELRRVTFCSPECPNQMWVLPSTSDRERWRSIRTILQAIYRRVNERLNHIGLPEAFARPSTRATGPVSR